MATPKHPYERRDLIGHFITKRQPVQMMCPHACCRGYRVHPANFPVVLPNKLLRRATDDDLAKHYAKMRLRTTPEADAAVMQALDEMDRRDRAERAVRERKEANAYARRLRAASRRMEHAEVEEGIFTDAERVTRGNWTNKAGDAAGITDRQILTGSDALFARYASEEARNYFREHPRPTPAFFRGANTRYVPRYTPTARGRRRAGLVAPRIVRTRTGHTPEGQRVTVHTMGRAA